MSPQALCDACHGGKQIPATGESRHPAVGKAHGSGTSLWKSGGRPGLDRESGSCLGCHDGTTARSSAIRVGGRGKRIDVSPMREHPMGMVYDRVWREPTRRLRPRAFLPSEIRLVDGRIGCTTCHSLYSSLPSKLVMSNRGSRLCLACHEL